MRIVVFSDSHNNYFLLRDIVLAQPEAEVFLHLGDGCKEFDYLAANFPLRVMKGLCGNCDWGSAGHTEAVTELGGKRIFYTHGHSYGVKSGLERLKEAARGAKADIALFGHTHVAMTFYEDGICYMNPGSLERPQRGNPSYGVVDITKAGIVTFIVEIAG